MRVIGTLADQLVGGLGPIVGYTIYKDGVPLTPTTALTTYDVTGLSPSTQYAFAVQGFDAQGNTTLISSNVLVTTLANAAPTWQAIPAQAPVVGNAYLLDLANYCSDPDTPNLTYSIPVGTPPTGITFSGSRLQGTPTTAGQIPTITVRAFDGFVSSDTTVSFHVYTSDVTPPPVPTGVTATTLSSSQIGVSWNASTDVAGSGDELVTGTKDYRLYRDGLLRVTQTGTSYTDTNLSAGTTYTYRITARDNALNESAQSTQASATTSSSGGGTVLADWTARSTAAGVVQAIRFTSATNVTTYAHNDGTQGNLSYDPLDGIIGDGCLKIYVPATAGANSGNWRAPLNSSWVTDQQGFGSTPFYIQYRIKLGTNRLTPSVNGGGFKLCNLSEYIPSSPGSSRSHSSNEIVIGDGFNGVNNWSSILYAYREHPVSGTTPFEYTDANGLHLQSIDNGAGVSPITARYCLYQSGSASSGCWRFVENQWFTVYYRIHIVDYGGAGTGNELDIWVARDGETTYTNIYSVRDFRIGSDSALPNGINGIWLLPYDTNRTSAAYETYHKYDQLIVSTQPIACPQVAAVDTTPVWLQSLTDKQWSTPTNNSTANAAGKAWIGGSGAIDPLAASNSGPTGGHHSIIDSYCGACSDPTTNEFGFPAAGGHNDYFGNEVYVLSLQNATLQWQRVTNADLHEGSSGSIGAWSTGRPTAAHLYSMMIGQGGVYYAFGRSAVPYNGFADFNPRVWTFTRSSNTWTDKGAIISPAAPYDGNQIVFYDRVNDQFIVILGGNVTPGVRIYRRSDLSLVSTANASLSDGGELAGSFDTTNRIVLIRGNAGYWWMKLTAPTVWNSITPSGTGPVYKDGFDWHWPSRAHFGFVEGVGLVKGTPVVSNGNYTGLAWSTVSGVTGAAPPGANRAGGAGTYNRFKIFEDLGGGRSVIVYHPAYTNPSPHIMRIPLAGM